MIADTRGFTIRRHDQLLIPPLHEGAQLQQSLQTGHPARSDLADERRFAERVSTEAGRLHLLAD